MDRRKLRFLKQMNIWVKSIIAVIAAFILFRSCAPILRGPHPLIGQSAPDFTLGTLGGRDETMSEVRAGRPSVIFFWATWCPHCRSQLAELTRLRESVEEKGIRIILVDVGEDARKVGEYFRAENIPFNTFLDQEGVVAGDYKIVGVPTFFFVNAQGAVVAAEHSLVRDYEQILLVGVP